MPLVTESQPSMPFAIRRIATLRVSAEIVVSMLQEMRDGKRYYTTNGLPEDARVVGIGLDGASTNTFTVLLESETFGDVPKGAIAPEIQVTITAHELETEPSWPEPALHG